MPLGASLGLLLNAASGLYARATRPATPPAIAVAPPRTLSPRERRRALDALVAAYPDHLRGYDDRTLHWHHGPASPLDGIAGQDAATIVAAPGILDIFAWPYPLAPANAGLPGDPGRARPAAFFTRVYGDCGRGEVASRLVPVRWVGGRTLRFTPINGAAAALTAVARDLEVLGPAYAKYLWPTSGTYNCRTIAGTGSPSMHGYGAAIDLASRFGSYWRWSRRPTAERTIPLAIVRLFEKHGFIWGGKWAHFDSFHFEYRPELILHARRSAEN